MQDDRNDALIAVDLSDIRSLLDSEGREALRRIVAAIDRERAGLRGFAAGYLESISEDAAVIAG